MSGSPELISVIVKWSGQEIPMENVSMTATVADLKDLIAEKTNVLPTRQKLLNLRFKGKAPSDEMTLAALSVKTGMKIMMMGSSEQVIKTATEIPQDAGSDVVNDFDDAVAEQIETEYRAEYLAKVEKRAASYEVKALNPSREGKKLLVLDIDYTLFDHRSVAETGRELMRPFLHEFLTAAYEDYDIVIWSATNMKWIEEKMKLLGCDRHPDYKLAFYLDSRAMVTIHSQKYGVIEVKALGVIWLKFPQYNRSNTIMFDDLRRNFLMNPANGLKIRPFKNAHTNRDTDRELIKLSAYLKRISSMESFDELNHKHWESFMKKFNF